MGIDTSVAHTVSAAATLTKTGGVANANSMGGGGGGPPGGMGGGPPGSNNTTTTNATTSSDTSDSSAALVGAHTASWPMLVATVLIAMVFL